MYGNKNPVSRWLLFDLFKEKMPEDAVLLDNLHDYVWKQVVFLLAFPLDNSSKLQIEASDSKHTLPG